MPPGGKVRNYAKLCKARKIRVILDLQMTACNSHPEAVSQLLSCQLHAVQKRAGRALADRVYMQVQSRLVEGLQDIRHPLRIKCGGAQLPGVRVRRNHGRGMDLLSAVQEDLQGMDLHVFCIELTVKTFQSFQRLL